MTRTTRTSPLQNSGGDGPHDGWAYASACLKQNFVVLSKIYSESSVRNFVGMCWDLAFLSNITLHYVTLELFRVAYTVCRTRNRKQLGRKWSGKEISFGAVSKNRQRWSWGDVGWQTVPEAASGNQKCTITVDQQWTAVFVGSLAARMTTTGDGDSWKQRRSGCSQKDTVAPGRAGIDRWAQLTWNRCVPETAASVGLAALVWRAQTEKIDVSVWRRNWEPTEVDWADTQEVLRVLRCSSRDVA